MKILIYILVYSISCSYCQGIKLPVISSVISIDTSTFYVQEFYWSNIDSSVDYNYIYIDRGVIPVKSVLCIHFDMINDTQDTIEIKSMKSTAGCNIVSFYGKVEKYTIAPKEKIKLTIYDECGGYPHFSRKSVVIRVDEVSLVLDYCGEYK